MANPSKYKFILIPPFHLPDEDQFTVPGYSVPQDKSKEERLLNNDILVPVNEPLFSPNESKFLK